MPKQQGIYMVQVLHNVGTPWEGWKLYTEEPMSQSEAKALRDEMAEVSSIGPDKVRVMKLVPA